MNTVPAIDYIMEDPREAARLEAKVDPKTWVQKYLAHRSSFGGLRARSPLE